MIQIVKARRRAALAALILFPAVASASDYTWIEGGFIQRHDYGQAGAGGRVAGSFDIPVLPLALIAEYSSSHDLNQYDAGAVFHFPIVPTLGLFAGATLEHGERNSGDTDTGVGGRAGLRWRPTSSSFELSPEVRWVHLFGNNETSVRLNGLVNLMPHLDLQGAIQGGDEQRYEVGLRYAFGSQM